MRASIRGSIRNVIVTDSAASPLPATADSMSRKSGRFSDQKFASASSLSNSGTSSQLANVRIQFFQVILILMLILVPLYPSKASVRMRMIMIIPYWERVCPIFR
jgi:hypothetical protein